MNLIAWAIVVIVFVVPVIVTVMENGRWPWGK